MANKKKQNISENYWMKFGGSLRKMNFGGDWSTPGGDWTGGREIDRVMGADSSMFHELTGKPITPWYPQYVPGHQRGRSNPERGSDFVYRNGGKPKSEFGFNINSGFDPMHPYDTWQTFGATGKNTSSRGSGDYVYANGGDPSADPTKIGWKTGNELAVSELKEGNLNYSSFVDKEDPITDPTFKAWFAKNARRPDVMKTSSNPDALRELFLSDVGMNELPLFSDEINDYGNIDKSGRDLGTSFKLLEKRYGGRNLPKAGSGIRIDATRDYSGIAERNPNFKQDLGTVGDTNLLQKLGPFGILADMALDAFGFSGDLEQHTDNVRDAHESTSTLNLLNRENVNKESLDMSTRTDALNALSGYLGTAAPDWQTELAPELIQGLGAMAKSGITGGGGGGGTGADIENTIPVGEGTSARYGGRLKAESGIHIKPENRGKFTNWASNHGMSVSEASNKVMGNTSSYSPGVVKMANFAKNARGWNKGAYGGRMAFESGMDLKDLHPVKAMGGTLELGPGAGTGLGKMMNPYSDQSLMASSGIDQSALSTGGPSTENYEAEGGEAIMHPEGGQPATTGNLEEVTSNVSMLEGASHEQGGEEVTGEGEQYVFSKKLRSDTWKKTFADAAETIAKNIEKFEKVSTEEDSDEITKSTANAMIQSWTQKLMELQQEQETVRKEKFMDMMNNGAPAEELQQSFPDLYEQFMQEQALQEQAQLQGAQGNMEQEAQMAANPMGDIDMSALSGEAQQMVGAKYGLPQMNHGGPHDDFDPYDFNTYTTDNVDFFKTALMGDEELNLSLGKDYKPSKKDLTSILTENFEEDGALFKGDIYTDAGLLSDAILTDYDLMRSAHIQEATGLKGKPNRSNYRTKDAESGKTSWNEGGQEKMSQDKAAWKMYNSGLGVNWSENFGADAGISERKYYKTFYNDLIAKGIDADLAKTLTEKEKLKKAKLDAANLELENQETELTDEQKAEQEIEKLARMKKNKEVLGNIGTSIADLAPTLYNFAMGNKKAAKTPYVGNKYEDDILDNLEKLGNVDIEDQLDQHEQTLSMAKYLARQHSDGSSGGYMTILNQFMNAKTQADRKAYFDKYKLDSAALTTINESKYNLGEKDRLENISRQDQDLQNEAAKQAFTAKGWEGISGYSQLQQKMKNSANRDEELRGLLDDIYPDASLYMTEEGDIDIQKILGENPELIEWFQKYFKE